MEVKWNKCMVCLGVVLSNASTPKNGPGRPNNKSKNGRNTMKLLINYLVGLTRSREKEGRENEEFVFENILKLEEECGGKEVFKLCKECELVVLSISELQLQLEVIQMKIIDLVETLRKEVLLSCSKITSENQIGKLFGAEKIIMEEIHSFQNAVGQNQAPIKVPFVLLERCLNFRAESSTVVNSSNERFRSTLLLLPQNEVLEEELLPGGDTYQNQTEAPSERVCFVKTEPQISVIEDNCNAGDDDDHHSFMESIISPEHQKLEVMEESNNLPSMRRSNRIRKIRNENILDSRVTSKRTNRTKGSKSSRKKTVHKKISKTKRSVHKNSVPPKQKCRRVYRKISCVLCPSFITKDFHTLEFHLRKHETGEKRFKCCTCPNDLWLSGEQLYRMHVASHSGHHSQICDICNKKIDHFLFPQHMAACSKGAKLFPCANCSYVTTTRDKLLTHLKVHDKSGQYFCDICGEEVESRRRLQEHLFRVHEAIERFTCSQERCEAVFFDKSKLYVHEQQHDRKFHCPICSKSFPSLDKLKVHNRIHTGELRVACPQCEDRFKTKQALDRHLILTHGAPKFQCQFCSKSFLDRAVLSYHHRFHKGSTFSCDQCGQQFAFKSILQRHIGTHSTQRNFVCEECGKDFHMKVNLWHHKKTHATEKNYKCEFCEKAFNVRKYLTDHLRTHTGERPFVCETCGATFNQGGALNIHKRKHL